jgi:hypothetical protein
VLIYLIDFLKQLVVAVIWVSPLFEEMSGLRFFRCGCLVTLDAGFRTRQAVLAEDGKMQRY